MKALLRRYLAWFAALKPGERNLVALAGLALAAFIPYALALEPAWREQRRLGSHLQTQTRTLAALQTEVAALAKSNVDLDQVSRQRIDELTRQLRALDETMRRSQKNLVPADQMARLLGNLLDRRDGLRIIALRTLPGTPLIERGAAAGGVTTQTVQGAASATTATVSVAPSANPGTPPASAGAALAAGVTGAPAVIFKHGVELVLQGSYAELSAYLERIERLPVQLFWARAVLDAEAYPQLTLTVSLFTIGLEAAWLSV